MLFASWQEAYVLIVLFGSLIGWGTCGLYLWFKYKPERERRRRDLEAKHARRLASAARRMTEALARLRRALAAARRRSERAAQGEATGQDGPKPPEGGQALRRPHRRPHLNGNGNGKH
jgi:hypothetical protein